MPKRIANGLTLLSAVVCVGSAMLVAGSWRWVNAVTIPLEGGRGGIGAYVIDGRLHLWRTRIGLHTYQRGGTYYRFSYQISSAAQFRLGRGQSWREMAGVHWLGIGWYTTPGPKIFLLPVWLLPLLTAIPPLRWYRARRRQGGRGFAVEGSAPEAE
jgi:hypothetical protein